MSQAVSSITARVRDRVQRERIELSAGREAQQLVQSEVRAYAERALVSDLPLVLDEAKTAADVLAQITGFGALQPFLDDPEIEEIWVNAPSRVFIARNGVPELTSTVIPEVELRDLVDRMLLSTGRRLDVSSPFVDASLPDGSRLHVVIPDVSSRYPAINIRKFARRIRDLNALVDRESLTAQAAAFLRCAVQAGSNILVAGATHTGKTTMVGALLGAAPVSERIVTVEETFELDLVARDVVAMQCRQPSLEGTGEITLRRLVKEALRMRPDRLVVGEVREAESLELLIALNSGLPGMCTIHANSARDALVKLSTLPLLAGRNIDSSFVVPTIASAIDLVVHLEILPNGRRQVHEILAPTGAVHAGVIEASTLFDRQHGVLAATGVKPPRLEKYVRRGVDPMPMLVPEW
ncbi:CpaF family protein [Gulosibacter molinativorax]|uniref:Pilus assembly protein CpaF n=1 Tax=Gulosibacter molinativorax TaxID=256821 RepID=A0ABT7CDD8_9MICO|nr:ATPase, T2SS/T4P/T4SS family [Gulosibacter molinativorax]MDJ1372496.1 pilus assembly protein CpaF [Gulosibacter molinativorax]